MLKIFDMIRVIGKVFHNNAIKVNFYGNRLQQSKNFFSEPNNFQWKVFNSPPKCLEKSRKTEIRNVYLPVI